MAIRPLHPVLFVSHAFDGSFREQIDSAVKHLDQLVARLPEASEIVEAGHHASNIKSHCRTRALRIDKIPPVLTGVR
jgi:hypothetical protein